jgi:hypothetical protein
VDMTGGENPPAADDDNEVEENSGGEEDKETKAEKIQRQRQLDYLNPLLYRQVIKGKNCQWCASTSNLAVCQKICKQLTCYDCR